MKEENGVWQNLKGKANKAIGDLTDNPEQKEKGRLQEKASEGKAAQNRLMDRGENP